ncbi:hypothetical protein Cgig2_025365 [Carnegiea gigantea]|uniref:Uncharacterized protein n=1 Tax=Carnegiea gigantea TaxID=171969 RepID=A0A9Q1JJP3_9CARY|nr:hypothetical protein Cgig2_025365 [Carnegiea gigantea]
MVQHCSTAVNAATTTPIRATTGHLQQVQERLQGNGDYHEKTRKTPIKITSTSIGNGLGNKSSMPRSDMQMFVAPGMLARGCGRKLHGLYASKSHSTCFLEVGINNKGYVESPATISKSTDGSLMRRSSIRANSGDGDPFNPMRHFSGFSDHGFPPSAPVHEDDVSNDGIDADNADNDNASFSENDTISSSEDKDLHNP